MRTLLATLFTALALALPAAATAQSARVNVDIKPQPMRSALKAFGDQTGLQVLYRVGDVSKEGITAPEVAGELAAGEALQRLLANSGLRFEFINERTVRITSDAVGATTTGNTELKQLNTGSALRLVVAEGDQSSSAQRVSEEAAPSESRVNSEFCRGNPDDSSCKESPGVQEILVTAQKRSERLQDVPIAISVLSGAELDRSTVQGVTKALNQVPGVAVTEGLAPGPQISIRGVAAAGNFSLGSSPVAYYLDSVPFGLVKTAVIPDTSAYDLDRIEVLRGPQGTLYGASAQNGVVRVLTQDANLGVTEFKTRGMVSATEGGGENYRADAAANVPILRDKLAARAVVGYQELGGWIDRPNRKDANDAKLLNVRFKANAQPTDDLSLGLSAWVSRSDFGAPSTGDDNNQHRSTYDEAIEEDYDSYAATLGYEFAAFSATSATSYLDFTNSSLTDSALTGLNILATDLDATVFTEEVNLNSTLSGPWKWSLGAIYRDAEDQYLQVRRNPATGAFVSPYQAPAVVKFLSKSFAVYGELTRAFLGGRFELTGGLRYFEDDVGQRELSRLTNPPSSQLLDTDRTFNAVSPRAILTWHMSADTMAYAAYSEGFRSGVDQAPTVLFAIPSIAPVDSDNLKNYEIGLKSAVLGGRLALDAAVYYMDWQRVQTPLLVNFNGILQAALVNGTSASGLGLDLGITAKPLDALSLTVGFSVNDLTQDADVFSNGNLLFSAGERLNLSPKYTAGGSADYQFALGAGGWGGRLSLGVNYTSARSQRLFSLSALTVDNKPLLIADASFAIEAPNNWTATLFGTNVNNEHDPILSVAPGRLPETAMRLRPRTLGLQFEYRFR